jgi:glutamate carboxypeptidase
MQSVLETLEKYVSMPSGTLDKQDVTALAKTIASDFAALGMAVTLIPGANMGPVVECVFGHGKKQLMLMGHMDTVFPRAECQPFVVEGDIAHGSGVCDMKGGIAVMLHALQNVLPKANQEKYTVKVVLNPDEEVGSPESVPIILKNAQNSFAALSFEPARKGGALTCERKGVTSFTIRCTGIRGHSGANYLKCASAIQELCQRINAIYELRDDSRDISVNIGVIQGGTAENVVADEAEARGEFRYYDQTFRQELMDKLLAICAVPGISGTTTKLTWGNTHPALKATEQSMELVKLAQKIAAEYGVSLGAESTGGAGDIAIAGLAGIPVLDGFGLEGDGMHTTHEFAYIKNAAFKVTLAERMMLELLK